MDFDHEHLSLIEQYEYSSLEIERIIFTKRYNLSKKHFSLIAVQSISILYSYWEGYIQRSFQMYIEYINSQNIKFRELNDEITVFHMENKFKQFFSYPDKVTKKIMFFKSLESFFIEKKHELYELVDTKSNVNFSILNKLLGQFALEKFPEQWETYKYPNTNLKDLLNKFIRYRNGVAHGGDISSEAKITQSVYSEYRRLIIDLMYAIHERFIYGIKNETFKKKYSLDTR